MSKLIDLSQDIIDQMPIHPYDDPVRLYQDKYLDMDQYNNFRVEIGMHSGTHIDGPMHLTNQNLYINQIPIEKFAGNGCLLDVRGEDAIGYKEEYDKLVKENDIVLLFTNHSSKYGTEDYYKNHPVVSEELTDFLIKRKIKMLGMDLPSPDMYPFKIHKRLFDHNILIIENMTGLSELVTINKFTVYAFPLKIKAEASMVRVVASVEI